MSSPKIQHEVIQQLGLCSKNYKSSASSGYSTMECAVDDEAGNIIATDGMRLAYEVEKWPGTPVPGTVDPEYYVCMVAGGAKVYERDNSGVLYPVRLKGLVNEQLLDGLRRLNNRYL